MYTYIVEDGNRAEIARHYSAGDLERYLIGTPPYVRVGWRVLAYYAGRIVSIESVRDLVRRQYRDPEYHAIVE